MAIDTQRETLGFQAEVTQLLDLMIHSLYSNKEIFLRELISNASDAADRLRFAVLSDESLYEGDSELKIRVAYDKDARTVTVSDNGIGMTRQEVIEHIGTIAKSGTREFFKALTGDQQKDANLIGQFGVGFYSAFVVAEKVTIRTRLAGLSAEQGVCWESEGRGEYTLEAIEKTTRGTDIILHLREGEDDFLNGYRLRSIIRKYSDHIVLPIVMQAEGKEAAEDEVVNRASALWARSKSEISEEEYTEFYRHIAHDGGEPLAYVHSRMEGTHEYILLLYIPERAPFDLWDRDRQHGVKLYVRRVFILDGAEQLLPRYLRFVRGVLDSNDLPLNVSREILQHNRLIDTMRSNAVKKVLGLLTDLTTKDKDKYATFWKAFGRVLKEGMIDDTANKDTLAKLLRFASTNSGSDTQDVSLDDYVGRMKEGQNKIYYNIAESFAAAKDSPLLEIFKKKNIEVLLLSDPVDHMVAAQLDEYQGFHLQSVSKGELDLGMTEEEQEQEKQRESVTEVEKLLERFKKALGEKVKDVRTTTRLTTSPSCLVVDEQAMDPSLRRLLKSAGQIIPSDRPILEINPRHPILLKMQNESDDKRFADWAYLLFEQGILGTGEQLENPVDFVRRLNDVLSQL